jgi:UDP-glucose 4-epimerase
MKLSDSTLLVTGAAGLIGSHVVERYAGETDVVAVDNLSKGRAEWVDDDATFVDGDLTDPDDVAEVVTEDVDVVFHFGAISDANYGDPGETFDANVRMLRTLLDRMDEVGVSNLAIASSSAVYGEAPRPTPESHAPLEPISMYGASKLAGEGLVSTYAHSHDLQAWQFRFANVVGPHQRNNVVSDFVEKLLDDPDSLTILGDGRQEKSYIHVEDCVDGICHVVEHATGDLNTYNLGTNTTIPVTTIADMVGDAMGLDPEYEFTGGDRGWTGDVPRMRLSIEKAGALGWEPSMESREAVERAATQLYEELR